MAKQAVKNPTETPAQLEQYYRDMLFIRHFEEKCNLAYRQGKVGGYMHTYIGMEALAVGWLESIKKGYDYVITAYRDHAHALLLGTDPTAIMAELMGRKTPAERVVQCTSSILKEAFMADGASLAGISRSALASHSHPSIVVKIA